jgi:ketosteroid isomerase-like protein
MNARLLLACLALTLGASSALRAQGTPQVTPADSIAIAEAARAFSAAYVRGDPEAMTAAYTDDAVIFPDRVAAISSRQAIQKYWTLPDNRRITQHQILPDELVIHGDVAYDHGRFTISGSTDGVPWGPSWGKYVVVWQRSAAGTWQMKLDIWNRLDQPTGD